MTGEDICDTETYTTAAGISGKCNVLCINLIRGGDKDSLHNANCKLLCQDCYSYYSTKANRDTTIPPAFTYKTPVQTTTTLLPPTCPSYETALTAGEIFLIVLASIFIAILVQDVLLILVCRKSTRLRKFVNKLIGCNRDGRPGVNNQGRQDTRAGQQQLQVPPQQTAPPAAQPSTTPRSGTSNNGVVVRNGPMQPNPGGPIELEGVAVEEHRRVDQNRLYPAAETAEVVPGPSRPFRDHDRNTEEKTPLMRDPEEQEQQPRVPVRLVTPPYSRPLGIPRDGASRAGVVPESGGETHIKVPHGGGRISERRPIRDFPDSYATQDRNEGDEHHEVVDDIGSKEFQDSFFNSGIVAPEQVSPDLKPGSTTDKGKGNHPRKGHRSGGSKKVS